METRPERLQARLHGSWPAEGVASETSDYSTISAFAPAALADSPYTSLQRDLFTWVQRSALVVDCVRVRTPLQTSQEDGAASAALRFVHGRRTVARCEAVESDLDDELQTSEDRKARSCRSGG
eukprot:1483512-Pleurochrysis_carterae.AAC.3